MHNGNIASQWSVTVVYDDDLDDDYEDEDEDDELERQRFEDFKSQFDGLLAGAL